MPEYLKQWIESLTADQKNELWNWLDGDPDAIYKMMDTAIPPDAEGK